MQLYDGVFSLLTNGIDFFSGVIKKIKNTSLNKSVFVWIMRIQCFFGHAQILCNVVHGNALKTKREKHFGTGRKNLFHSSCKTTQGNFKHQKSF